MTSLKKRCNAIGNDGRGWDRPRRWGKRPTESVRQRWMRAWLTNVAWTLHTWPGIAKVEAAQCNP